MQLHTAAWLPLLQLFLLSSSPSLVSAKTSTDSNPESPPCTIYSPTSGSFFDLNAISLSPPKTKDGKAINDKDRTESWHARGYDYGANFTLNFCAPVVEKLESVVGVDQSRVRNVSAYYTMNGKTFSIGQQAAEPIFRGRKLVLNYTDGSPCPEPSTYKNPSSSIQRRKILDNEEDHDNDWHGDRKDSSNAGYSSVSFDEKRRKSTIMSFLCDKDPQAPPVTVSFVGSPDSCSYFFEVRSPYACGGVAPSSNGGLGPAGVFGVILLIAVAAYLIGGCAYQRTVMHQRGWRQCPNYSLWAGMSGFLKDIIVIGFSSLGRCLRLKNNSSGSGRYSHLNGNDGYRRSGLVGAIGGRGNGRNSGRADVDAENRLIDQLDEEWDD